MGYDLMNEPWAGIEWPLCLLGGCGRRYVKELQPAQDKALAGIRTVDPATSSGASRSSSPAVCCCRPSSRRCRASRTSACPGTTTAARPSSRSMGVPAGLH